MSAGKKGVTTLFVGLPKPNEIVGLNEPFVVAGGADLNNLREVTIQVDAGPVMRANVTIIPHVMPPRVVFVGFGTVTTPGRHAVTVEALYWEIQTQTVTVDIQAQGTVE